ncbi:hypothetical protein Tco_1318334 [Tanacetum coccineum]
MQSQLADARVASTDITEELSQSDAKLSEQVLIVRDLQNELALESVEGLVRRLLSSDEFHAAVAHVASLVSNFHIGAKAEFEKALVDFPTTSFPFLGKVAAAARGALSEVTQILSDKLAHSATPVLIVSPIVNEVADQVPLDHASDDSASSI